MLPSAGNPASFLIEGLPASVKEVEVDEYPKLLVEQVGLPRRKASGRSRHRLSCNPKKDSTHT